MKQKTKRIIKGIGLILPGLITLLVMATRYEWALSIVLFLVLMGLVGMAGLGVAFIGEALEDL